MTLEGQALQQLEHKFVTSVILQGTVFQLYLSFKSTDTKLKEYYNKDISITKKVAKSV